MSQFFDAEHWTRVLGEKPREALDRFLREGLLERAGLSELIAYKFKTVDLKAMAKEKGLKVTGRKEELIQRLVEDDAEGVSKATQDIELYGWTAEGGRLAEEFIASEKIKRKTAEREVADLLDSREFAKAVQVVVAFEISQVFPRGLGIDWKNYNIVPDTISLKTIFNSTPTILSQIEEGRLKCLRLAAGMMQLWGVGSVRDWLPKDFETGIHLDPDSACRMFVFHASHIRNLTTCKDTGARTVTVVGAFDGKQCSPCRRIGGKKYPSIDVPELPFVHCKSDIGCRCTIVIEDFP